MEKAKNKYCSLQFSRKLRMARKRSGLTQRELSFKIDVSERVISNIENFHGSIGSYKLKALERFIKRYL